jgi:hypothetical protein
MDAPPWPAHGASAMAVAARVGVLFALVLATVIEFLVVR